MFAVFPCVTYVLITLINRSQFFKIYVYCRLEFECLNTGQDLSASEINSTFSPTQIYKVFSLNSLLFVNI